MKLTQKFTLRQMYVKLRFTNVAVQKTSNQTASITSYEENPNAINDRTQGKSRADF